ncbi:MAG: ATP-binding protein [Phycisphaerales bacterium]
MPEAASRVGIRPGVNILGVLRHLEYKPWHALAEYVDNSTQSFLSNRDRLADAGSRAVRVEIEFDTNGKTIQVRDNAAGIRIEDFPRAFRPAEAPPQKGGLSEFGMGMKSASCWFAPQWSVRTSALGDPFERRVSFNIEQIVQDKIEELDIERHSAPADAHYTIVELNDCRTNPKGRTIGKIKDHLSDIYRDFLRHGELELICHGQQLEYQEPDVLNAPRFGSNHEPDGDPIEWRRTIDLEIGDNGQGGQLRARGFAGLLRKGSTATAGLSLFRRRRVIQGSGDEKYRPPYIFGASNSYVFQRLFGEIHLEGFDVSHTKDGFRWEDREQDFLDLLKHCLDEDDLPLIRQARNYREKVSRESVGKVAEQAAQATAEGIRHGVPGAVHDARTQPPPATEPESALPPSEELAAQHIIEMEVDGHPWQVVLELDATPSDKWLDIAQAVTAGVDGNGRHQLGVRMSLAHPFMSCLPKLDRGHVEPLLRVAAGLALAEKIAADAGNNYPAAVRTILNRLMRGPLAGPGIQEDE